MLKVPQDSKILITGTAGFIGFHLTRKLAEEGHVVTGLDCINSYYDINLKYGRMNELGFDHHSIEYGKPSQSAKYKNLDFYKINLEDRDNLYKLFELKSFDTVINLAAQAGVRYSLENPHAYIESNITGFLNILEACRHNATAHLIYASSSSVYGLNELMPFSAQHPVDHPISLYAASKKSNEMMAHSYSCLFNLPTTGLRFFTVYGPWGRPDMALFIFTKAILANEPVNIFNNGNMLRDFTYVDDIVNGIAMMLNHAPVSNKAWTGKNPDPASSKAPYRIYNIGNNKPVKLMDFIEALEEILEKKALRNMMPMQLGDVPATYADVSGLVDDFGYKPDTGYREGIRRFVDWYRWFYKI
jgi:UDP-glucuronate 4-epimerase